MIPVIGSDGWFLMPLPSTKFTPAKTARVKVRDGRIVTAFVRTDYIVPGLFGQQHEVKRRLHWAEGLGSWVDLG